MAVKPSGLGALAQILEEAQKPESEFRESRVSSRRGEDTTKSASGNAKTSKTAKVTDVTPEAAEARSRYDRRVQERRAKALAAVDREPPRQRPNLPRSAPLPPPCPGITDLLKAIPPSKDKQDNGVKAKRIEDWRRKPGDPAF